MLRKVLGITLSAVLIFTLAGCQVTIKTKADLPSSSSAQSVSDDTKSSSGTQDQTNDSSNASAGTVYTNSKYGFQITYPKGWTVSENVANAVCAFLSPKDDATANFNENISIVAQALNGETYSYDDIVTANKQQLQETLSNLNILNEGKVEIDGTDAYAIQYTASYQGVALEWEQAIFIEGDYEVVLTYAAQQAGFNTYQDVAEACMSSFTTNA